MRKADILRLVAEDLAEVEIFLKELTNSAVPLLDRINQYLHSSGGKRLRPAVLLLAGRMCGYQGRPATELAAVVELIHVATLVHDDIIDNADLRRGRESVNARWGNQITVLAGDWLYMTAFQIALQLHNFRILDILIDITRTMVEGELIQLDQQGKLGISAEDQMEISSRKTGRLFGGCGRLAAIVSGVDAPLEEKLAEYGRCLGIAFQLTDDLLDYSADQDVIGKPVLKDLEEGKVTLPIIYLQERASSEEKSFLRQIVQEQDFSAANKAKILEMVSRHQTLSDLHKLALGYAEQAVDSLSDFPESVYKDALLRLPDFVVNRRR